MSDATDHQLSSHPPVTDWTTDFDHAVDEYAARAPEIWDELRSACPVAHSERYGGVWLPTRHEDVAAIAYDTEHFTSRSVVVTEGRPIAPAPRGIAPPISSDPPFHQEARRMLLPAFSPKAVNELEPYTRAYCNELLDAVAGAETFDAAVDYAQHIPVRVIAKMLGFPPEDGDIFRRIVHNALEAVDLPQEQRMMNFLTLDEYLRTHVLGPLGMVDTDFWTPDRDRLTSNYVRNRQKVLRPIDTRAKTGFDHRPTYLSGAGGLVSTAADYQRFLHMLANGGTLDGARVIGRKTLEHMVTNQLPDGATLNDMGQSTFAESAMEGVGFGLGFSVVVDPAASRSVTSVGEYGWGGAASTAFWVDPVEELTVLFLTQLLPSNTYPIRRQLRATVAQALL